MSKTDELVAQAPQKVTIRFSGDSGDGMQYTGLLFSDASAIYGNDIATFPDFPSEIRAPQGTVAGVSAFQVHIGETKVHTPGDYADILIAFNPAALKANLKWVKVGGTLIVDADSFVERNLQRAGYTSNPLEDGSLLNYNIVPAPITSQTQQALKDTGLSLKSMMQTRNMFALGISFWLFNRPLEHTEKIIEKKFAKNPGMIEANKIVLHEGYKFAETAETLTPYTIRRANIQKGRYRNIVGNTATAWGLMAAAEKAGLEIFLGSYPITPATDILQEISKHKSLGAKVMQCEDEIAGICTTIGASFAGSLGITTTSGPGLALKTEAIGLAIMLELPLVIVDVQRSGPSTGLPTKTEQGDLMQAVYGRNGESPCIVLAASLPSDCFEMAYQAVKLAIEHMTPVILLTDGYLANGSQLWRIPRVADLPEIKNRLVRENKGVTTPFMRDTDTLARNWVVPGVPELMHRIGGLEKDIVTGVASHDPMNHQKMVQLREEKVQRVKNFIPELTVEGAESGDLLVVGWGSTYGHLSTVVRNLHCEGKNIGLAQFNYIKPLPRNTVEVFSRFKRIIVCELNLGQFANWLRMNVQQFEYHQFNKIQGLPFTEEELQKEFLNLLAK